MTPEQEQAAKDWAADDRLWTTQETVEINLRTFARVILKSASPSRLSEGQHAIDKLAGWFEAVNQKFTNAAEGQPPPSYAELWTDTQDGLRHVGYLLEVSEECRQTSDKSSRLFEAVTQIEALIHEWREAAKQEARDRDPGWPGAEAKLQSCADELEDVLTLLHRPHPFRGEI